MYAEETLKITIIEQYDGKKEHDKKGFNH